MPLTADDVVQKRFNPTKFREGYDQDEVDDFLDEVVAELRRLQEESADLRRQLAECEGRATGSSPETVVEAGAAAAGPAATPSPPPGTTDAPATEATTGPALAASTAGTGDVSGMLALAQRLHDEHVHNGEQERDRLVSEAQEKATRLVHEAEEKQAQTLGTLEQERSLLERKIDELRGFERDYRSRLRSYLENQLRDLDSKGQVVPGRTPGAAGSRGGGDDAAGSGGFPLGGKS